MSCLSIPDALIAKALGIEIQDHNPRLRLTTTIDEFFPLMVMTTLAIVELLNQKRGFD